MRAVPACTLGLTLGQRAAPWRQRDPYPIYCKGLGKFFTARPCHLPQTHQAANQQAAGTHFSRGKCLRKGRILSAYLPQRRMAGHEA